MQLAKYQIETPGGDWNRLCEEMVQALAAGHEKMQKSARARRQPRASQWGVFMSKLYALEDPR